MTGLCPLCLEESVLDSDHDHETGNIRAYICRPCNARMAHCDNGNLQDRIEHLREELEELVAWELRARAIHLAAVKGKEGVRG